MMCVLAPVVTNTPTLAPPTHHRNPRIHEVDAAHDALVERTCVMCANGAERAE